MLKAKAETFPVSYSSSFVRAHSCVLACLFATLAAAHTGSADETFSDAAAAYERAQETGFRWTSREKFPSAFITKAFLNTDDGPYGAPQLGGIGTGVFGRDLQGRFNRWQLQPGFQRTVTVNSASLCVRWQQGDRKGAYRVGEGDWDKPLPAGSRSVAILWPITHERLSAPDWPVEAIIESWSPVIPHDYESSALPIAFFDVYVRNTSAAEASLDLALFLPNFLNWRPGATNSPSASHNALAWADWSNGGNYSAAAALPAGSTLREAVLFRNENRAAPVRDMEGEVLLGVGGGSKVRAQRELCFIVTSRADTLKKDGMLQRQAEMAFFETGRLPAHEFAWHSNHNEVLGSAVAGGLTLPPGGEGHFTLVVAWDLPLAAFGAGRTWEKAYTTRYGADGRQAARIAEDALAKRAEWRARLDAWHERTLGKGSAAERKRRGAAINDLYYVNSGGTNWVARQHSANGLEAPLLGAGEHFAVLEGRDSGYYFYNTFDLWPHAQAAFDANWPRLSALVYDDYLRTVPLLLPEKRFISMTGGRGVRKVADKIPHDLGSPPGDPWHVINEYNAVRDSNVWKDHNPAFALGFYLHRKHTARGALSDAEWATLLKVADFMIAQDKDEDGLPDHDTHGDNTWDALEVTGPAPYSGALTLGALAAMAEWSRLRGDSAREKLFAHRQALARESFERHFWNGQHYRSATKGDRAEWILADALFGILLAEAAGLRDLLPREHIAAHLRAVCERNWHGFADGTVGPSLFAPPAGDIPAGTQIGEVLVGSAHACIALMRRVGLGREADAMADAMNKTLYERSGMQFRTPAAWTPAGTYRSPSNLRPLASWHSLWPVPR